MTITFTTFQEILPFVASIKKPVLMRGRHGIGKSALVYQFAQKNNMKIVERRASQMSDGDILGIPIVNKKKQLTEWLCPDWLKEACQDGVVLFLDEIDRAQSEVRQGLFQLMDSRKIASWELHPDTLIFAAINGGEECTNYQVFELDPAELDRYTVFDLEPTLEEFVEYGKNSGICSIILEFILNNPKHLEQVGDISPNKVYPSRRSWDRLNQCLMKANLLSEETKNNKNLVSLCSAFIGFEASISFADFIKNYSFQVHPEDIIEEGKIEKTKNFNLNDHLALIEKISLKGYWNKKLTKKQAENVSDYFVSLPPEIAMKMLSDIGNIGKGEENKKKSVEHNLKLIWKTKNGQAQKFMGSILTKNVSVSDALKKEV